MARVEGRLRLPKNDVLRRKVGALGSAVVFLGAPVLGACGGEGSPKEGMPRTSTSSFSSDELAVSPPVPITPIDCPSDWVLPLKHSETGPIFVDSDTKTKGLKKVVFSFDPKYANGSVKASLWLDTTRLPARFRVFTRQVDRFKDWINVIYSSKKELNQENPVNKYPFTNDTNATFDEVALISFGTGNTVRETQTGAATYQAMVHRDPSGKPGKITQICDLGSHTVLTTLSPTLDS